MRTIRYLILAVIVFMAYGYGSYSTIHQTFPFYQVRMMKKTAAGEELAFINPAALLAGQNDDWLDTQADIVMLGDSITASARWHEMFPASRIINRGIGGDTLAGLAKRLQSTIKAQPDKIFIMIGINDIYGENSVSYMIEKYVNIVKILSPHAKVFVQSTLACNGDSCTPARQNTVAAINHELLGMCQQQNCTFIDLNQKFAPDGRLLEGLTTDGMHLNGPGFKLWQSILIPPRLPPQVQPPPIL